MPLYDYKCKKGHCFEKWLNKPTTKVICPKCKTIALKQWSVPNIVFKGPGFYITENRKDKIKKEKLKAQDEIKNDKVLQEAKKARAKKVKYE